MFAKKQHTTHTPTRTSRRENATIGEKHAKLHINRILGSLTLRQLLVMEEEVLGKKVRCVTRIANARRGPKADISVFAGTHMIFE